MKTWIPGLAMKVSIVNTLRSRVQIPIWALRLNSNGLKELVLFAGIFLHKAAYNVLLLSRTLLFIRPSAVAIENHINGWRDVNISYPLQSGGYSGALQAIIEI